MLLKYLYTQKKNANDFLLEETAAEESLKPRLLLGI